MVKGSGFIPQHTQAPLREIPMLINDLYLNSLMPWIKTSPKEEIINNNSIKNSHNCSHMYLNSNKVHLFHFVSNIKMPDLEKLTVRWKQFGVSSITSRRSVVMSLGR
jgi:hypothetical protein